MRNPQATILFRKVNKILSTHSTKAPKYKKYVLVECVFLNYFKTLLTI